MSCLPGCFTRTVTGGNEDTAAYVANQARRNWESNVETANASECSANRHKLGCDWAIKKHHLLSIVPASQTELVEGGTGSPAGQKAVGGS